jgi:hypothetical protein
VLEHRSGDDLHGSLEEGGQRLLQRSIATSSPVDGTGDEQRLVGLTSQGGRSPAAHGVQELGGAGGDAHDGGPRAQPGACRSGSRRSGAARVGRWPPRARAERRDDAAIGASLM